MPGQWRFVPAVPCRGVGICTGAIELDVVERVASALVQSGDISASDSLVCLALTSQVSLRRVVAAGIFVARQDLN